MTLLWRVRLLSVRVLRVLVDELHARTRQPTALNSWRPTVHPKEVDWSIKYCWRFPACAASRPSEVSVEVTFGVARARFGTNSRFECTIGRAQSISAGRRDVSCAIARCAEVKLSTSGSGVRT